MKILLKSRKIAILILSAIIVIAVPTSVFGYNSYNFNKLYNRGNELLANENFDEAISAFTDSLKYMPNQKELVESKVSLSKDFKESKATYESAVSLENEKKYLEEIDAYKKIKITDLNRYSSAQNKIKECGISYINENLEKAKNQASSKNFESAISYLDTILKFDAINETAQSLKNEYSKKISEEKASSAEQRTVKASASPSTTSTAAASSSGDVVKSNNNLYIVLNGGSDPSIGRIMALRMAGFDPQPFGIVFQVIQCGFGYEVDYDITIYLAGRTVTYSGKTSGDLVRIPVSLTEVPRGENQKVIINFYVNGKTYTSTGTRVFNSNFP